MAHAFRGGGQYWAESLFANFLGLDAPDRERSDLALHCNPTPYLHLKPETQIKLKPRNPKP